MQINFGRGAKLKDGALAKEFAERVRLEIIESAFTLALSHGMSFEAACADYSRIISFFLIGAFN